MQKRNKEKNVYFYRHTFYKTNLVSYCQVEKLVGGVSLCQPKNY